MKKLIVLLSLSLATICSFGQKNMSCMDRAYAACEHDTWCSIICLSNPLSIVGCALGWAATCLMQPDINWDTHIRMIMPVKDKPMWIKEFPKNIDENNLSFHVKQNVDLDKFKVE